MFAVNVAFTCERYISTLSPYRTLRCGSRVLPSGSPTNRHSNDSAAPSKLISIVAALGGVTSRRNQRSGSCPGKRVAPREPVANGPYNSNSAGGCSKWAISVQQCQVNDG